MASFNFETPFSGAGADGAQRTGFVLLLQVNTTDRAAQNRTDIEIIIRIRPPGNWTTYSGFANDNSWLFSSSEFSSAQNFTYSFQIPNQNRVLEIGRRNYSVNHNSNGSKSINVSYSANSRLLGSASRSNMSIGLTTYPRAPSAPSFVNAQAPIARSIAVNWGASSGGAGVSNYTLQRRVNSGGYSTVTTTGARNYTDRNLVPGYTYRYQVRANGPGGSSGFRQSNSRTIAPAASPPVTTAERTLRTVEVTMTEPSVIDNTTNIVSYTTERRQNGGNWGDQKTTTDLNNRSITYTDLPSETNQQFRGRANTNRGSSNFSESQTLFIPGLPDAPAQVNADRFGANIMVVLVAGGDGGAPILAYTVEKRTSENLGVSWSEWGDPEVADAAGSIYFYESLELQKTYQFRAFATNEEGNSEQFTESNTVYLPAIMRIYDDGQFRLPADYKRYSEDVGDWVGLSISRRYFNGQWIDLE